MTFGSNQWKDLLPDDVKVELPKFARVNKLLTSLDDVLIELRKQGFTHQTVSTHSGTAYIIDKSTDLACKIMISTK